MEIRSFAEFWPYYVGEHRLKATRVWHFCGTTLAMATLAAAMLRHQPLLLLAIPIAGYAPAWYSHFFIEKNRPATFKYPRWSLMADFIMWGKMVSGSMDAEVERCLGQNASAQA